MCIEGGEEENKFNRDIQFNNNNNNLLPGRPIEIYKEMVYSW